jgi:hypothetical protein
MVGTIKRVVTDQGITVTLNLAEGTMANLGIVIPRSLESPAKTLTLGKDYSATFPYLMGKLVLVGKNPDGNDRTVTLHKVTSTGDIGIPYKKGEISVVPVTFSVMKDGIPANTATYNTFGTIEDK